MSQNVHNFGETVRDIRIKKNLTQEEVAKDIPIATYRRFEQGKTTPSVALFFSILENLELTVTEFLFLHDRNKYEFKESLLYLFKNIRHTLNKDRVTLFQQKTRDYLSKHDDQSVRNLYLLSKAAQIFTMEDDLQQGKYIMKPVFQSLKEKENWFYWDALVAQGTILFSDSMDGIEIAEKAHTVFKEYDEIYPSKETNIRVLLNLCYCLKFNNDILSAEPYIKKAIEESKNANDQSLFFDAQYMYAQVLLEKGLIGEAQRLATSSITQLRAIDSQFADDNQMEWDRLLVQKNIKKT